MMIFMQLFHTVDMILKIKPSFKEGKTVSMLGNNRSRAGQGEDKPGAKGTHNAG